MPSNGATMFLEVFERREAINLALVLLDVGVGGVEPRDRAVKVGLLALLFLHRDDACGESRQRL